MKVTLISYTQDALDILLFTKSTRLKSGSMAHVAAMPMAKKLEQLEYMRNTIKSSWEFVTYIFQIQDVTRAFTHQLVRTRTGSYAQEAQRVVDASRNGWAPWPHDREDWLQRDYDTAMADSFDAYKNLMRSGAHPQDARGVLPTNTYTSICAQFNLRSMHEMAKLRLCTRVQSEYQDVFREMKERVIEVHPWAEDFIQVQCAWDGTCAFPLYDECPIQHLTRAMGPAELKVIRQAHADIRHEAKPIVKDGRTM